MSERDENQHDGLDRHDNAPGMTDLPDDVIKTCLSFVGPGYYRLVAGTCKRFREQYSFPKETTWNNAAASVSCARFCLADNEKKTAALSRLQFLDMLQQEAVQMGQLDVLKWSLEKHGCACAFTHFALAGSGGHLHVLQWAEENGMEWYSEYLWVSAAQNGHTHILEWIHGFHYVPGDVASYALDMAVFLCLIG
jgi:hypothetical protein